VSNSLIPSDRLPVVRRMFDDADRQRWREVAKATAIILAVTQRKTGLWSYPTNEDEVLKYNEDSLSFAFEQNYGSYTGSWSYLLALERLYGQIPERMKLNLQTWFEKNPSENGGFGRPIKGGRGVGSRVDATARHTAYALLIRLRFLPLYRAQELSLTVDWILRNEDDGWKYRGGDSQLDAMSTGACIAALAYYLEIHGKKLPNKAREVIKKAIRSGFRALMRAAENDQLWVGHRANETDIIDSALILEVLALPEVLPSLSGSVGDAADQIERCRTTLLKTGYGSGWPPAFGKTTISLPSTINSLVVLLDQLLAVNENVLREHLRTVLKYIVEETERSGVTSLMSWEWAYLASLSAALLTYDEGRVLSDLDRKAIERTSERLKEGSLFTKTIALSSVASIYHRPVVFAISQGRVRFERQYLQMFKFARGCLKMVSLVTKAMRYLKPFGLSPPFP
jgi:hypothetical protein